MQRTDQTRQVPAYRIDRWIGRSSAYCVVIPVINEADRIGRLLARMSALELAKQADLIVVDGGSTDGSLSEKRLEAGGVAGLIVKTGPGRLSAQLRCAYDFALIQGYEGIVTIDGNDKDDPQAVPAFINALKAGHDFVQASRFIAGGIEENTPWKRRLAIRLIHAPLLRLASGFPWTDTTQGFRAYSRRLLEDPGMSPFRDAFNSYELLAYMNYRAPQLGFRCIELPTARRYPKDKVIPTKISSFRGELGVLRTLLDVCRGKFNSEGAER
jgi:dolichol-phosphate mannosyltransferase